jgi:hypothetical protein
MQLFHERLEKISDQVRADPQLAPKSPYAARLRRYYSAEALTALESEIVAARKAVNDSDDPDMRTSARIEMAADSVKYARLITTLLEVAHDKKSPRFIESLAAVESFLKTKVLTPELAPLHSHRYLRMALAYAEREVE